MADRRQLSRAVLWVLAALACGEYETSTLELVVRVDPGAAQAASGLPAQVLVGFDSGGGGYLVFRVGFLCEPSSAPFVATARFSDVPGAAVGATADAWVVPIDAGAPFACGPLAEPRPVSPFAPPPAGARRTSARIQVLAGCGEGEVRSATLVIGHDVG